MSNDDFNFLSERPLKTSKELSDSEFGHEEIATTLVKIVKKCPAPFTIGLFAKWGSGKSTVAFSLKEKLPKEKIPVVLFDVWKHEGDALRRTFLKEVCKQLKEYGSEFFDENFVLDEKLENSVTRSADSRFSFAWERLRQLAWPLIVGITSLPIGYFVAAHFNYLEQFQSFVTALFGTATAGGLLLLLAKQSLQLLTTETVSYGVDKFEDPQQFENEFANILCALKNRRILIIFDNLDRVMHDKVAEVLSTIKTFLEPQDRDDKRCEVVFLVPCDAKAIKQHLSSVYNPADKIHDGVHAFDPDEFLRKFFNSIIWIPDFIPSELESFASSRLRETKVAVLDNDLVAWIITKAFRNNPRQIIQFTNILLANYLLVKEREGKDKDFSMDFLKENIPQLTKYLILNQLFPDEMDVLRERKVLDLKGVETDVHQTKSASNFIDFVDQTKNIPINDLRIYFTLRRSKQEKNFPGFESFISLLEDGNIEEAKKQFGQLGDFSTPAVKADFSQAIKEELESKTNRISSVNLIHTLLTILTAKKITLTETLYEEINNVLNKRCKAQLHTINPTVLNDGFVLRKAAYKATVIAQWIAVIEDVANGENKYSSNKDFVKTVLGIFASQTDYLNTDQEEKLQTLLTHKYPSDLEIAETITASSSAQSKLNSSKYIERFITAIPNGGDITDVSARLKIVNKFESQLFDDLDSDFLVKKLGELQAGENQNTKLGSFQQKGELLNQYRNLIAKHGAIIENTSVTVLDTFIAYLINGLSVMPDFDSRSVFIPILFEIKKFAVAAKAEEVERNIAKWAANTKSDVLLETAGELSEADRPIFFSGKIQEAIISRGVSDATFRTEISPHLTENQKKELFTRLLNTDYERALECFESIDAKDAKIVFLIADKLWQIFESMNQAQKKRVFKFVNKYKANNEASVRETLATKIIAMLTMMNDIHQQLGLEALQESTLSKELKRRIVKELFDWIKKQEVQPKYQPHTLNAIVSLTEELNQEEQRELIQFIFDELIRKSSDSAQIGTAFDLLASFAPKYEELQQNFDDVKSRIEKETNVDVKQALLNGIRKLKPTKTNKENQDYWKRLSTQ